MARINRRSAFTLVEILIVVVILAILAAVVIPQFTDSTKDAKDSTAVFNLQTMRSQIAIYRAQHNGTNPSLANIVTQLTSKTNPDGTSTGTPTLGPYLQNIPNNVLVDTNGTLIGAAATNPPTAEVANVGWQYDATTGNIFINKTGYFNK